MKRILKILIVTALLVLIPFTARAGFIDDLLSSFGSLTQEAQLQALKDGFNDLNEVLLVETGELAEIVDAGTGRTFLGDMAGNENMGVGSIALGWRAAMEATGSGLYIGSWSGRYAQNTGDVGIGNFVLDDELYNGDQNTVIGGSGAGALETGSNNTLMGNGVAMRATVLWRNVILGLCAGCSADEIHRSVILGEDAASLMEGIVQDITVMGWESAKEATGDRLVCLGYRSCFDETEDDIFEVANGTSVLLKGSFADNWLEVSGDLEAERVVISDAILFIEGGELKVDIGGVVSVIQTVAE